MLKNLFLTSSTKKSMSFITKIATFFKTRIKNLKKVYCELDQPNG